ncbi:MAG: phage portal protein [Candidatus Shapirobacteria bacterium]|nr:phage portal protein [Candidatus Shapirobacteria bacterium]
MITIKDTKPIVARNYVEANLLTDGVLDKKAFEDYLKSEEFGNALSSQLKLCYEFCVDQDYYYFGTNQSADFRPNNSKDNKTLVNYPSYITSLFTSFLTSKPVEFQTKKEKDFSDFKISYQDLLNNMSKYGKCYVIVQNSDGKKFNRIIPPWTIFDIRDSGLDSRLVARCFVVVGSTYTIHVFTDTTHVVLSQQDDKKAPTLTSSTLHSFSNKIPIVEFVNNSDQYDDYSLVRNLVNFYNVVQSGRLNDRQELLDALLLAYGVTLTPTQKADLKKTRVLAGIPKDSKLEYLIKNIDEGQVEQALKSIKQDIHRIAKVPDFSDENFYSTTSGIAMKYRLFLFSQKANEKKTNLSTGLLELLGLYYTDDVIKDINVVVSSTLPTNDLEISQMITNLDGKVDTPTLISQLSFVNDGNEIFDLAQKELEIGTNSNYNDLKDKNGKVLDKTGEPVA